MITLQGGTEKREAEKRAQVEQDRRLAQQIVLHEARQKGLSMKNEGKYIKNGDPVNLLRYLTIGITANKIPYFL